MSDIIHLLPVMNEGQAWVQMQFKVKGGSKTRKIVSGVSKYGLIFKTLHGTSWFRPSSKILSAQLDIGLGIKDVTSSF